MRIQRVVASHQYGFSTREPEKAIATAKRAQRKGVDTRNSELAAKAKPFIEITPSELEEFTWESFNE